MIILYIIIFIVIILIIIINNIVVIVSSLWQGLKEVEKSPPFSIFEAYLSWHVPNILHVKKIRTNSRLVLVGLSGPIEQLAWLCVIPLIFRELAVRQTDTLRILEEVQRFKLFFWSGGD